MDEDRPGWNPPAAQDAPELSTAETIGSRGRRSRVGTGVAVAAIAIGALGIAGTAYAATSTPSPDAPRGSQGYGQPGERHGNPPGNAPGGLMPGGPRGDGGGRHGMGKGMGISIGDALHGTVTVEKQGGGYQTLDGQRGAVTAVSKDSITVKSVDGFSRTYVVTADTLVNAKRDGIASINTGDEVAIIATAEGDTSTAVRIMDRTQIGDDKKKNAPDAPPAMPAAPLAPSGSGTA